MTVTRKLFRLAAKWSRRESDIVLDVSPRMTSADMHWLAYVFNKDFTAELVARGYDLKTLRFHVDKTPEAVAEHFKIYPNSTYLPIYEKQIKKNGKECA